MKKLACLSMVFLALVLAGNGLVQGQTMDPPAPPAPEHHSGKGVTKMQHLDMMGIPGLTEEQKSKIKELRFAHMREVQTLRNQLGELRARQKTLTTADKPDMKAIEANIDNMTGVMNKLLKLQANHRQQIRALLTPEQRLAFDMHANKKGHSMMKRAWMDREEESAHPGHPHD